MSKKGDLKAFQAVFVAADANLDDKVCREKVSGSGDDTDGKQCNKTGTGTDNGLSKVYEVEEKIDAEAGANIATSLSKLSKEEKATLAAAFAKAVEGAEVVEISSVDSGSIREYG